MAVETMELAEASAVENLISISSIVSPSGQEKNRALFMAEKMRSIGLEDVYVDEAFNAVGKIKGRSEKAIVFVTMLDDLPEMTELQKSGLCPHREGDKVFGPGTDIQSCNAAVLLALEALIKMNITPPHDIIFASVSQERTGLIGMKKLFETWKDRAEVWVDVLGDGQKIVYGAPFIHWWKIVANGTLGNTEENWLPNVNKAIARAVDNILTLSHPEDTFINVGMIHSGTTYNYKPESGWFSLDLRSISKEDIQDIESNVKEILHRVSQETDVKFQIEKTITLEGGQIPGAKESYIVQLASTIASDFGYQAEVTPKGCCNMIIPISQGHHAIGLHGERGGQEATAEEWASIPAMLRCAKFVLLLATSYSSD